MSTRKAKPITRRDFAARSLLATAGAVAGRTASTETFPGDDEANRLLTREYREPFAVAAKP